MYQAFVVLKLLGLTFDNAMNLESHIAHVCNIAYIINLRNIRKISNVLTDHSAAQLIHAIISSRIDYFYLFCMEFMIL